jgi:hypothetical protein
MKTTELKERLGKERPMSSVTLRVPADVIEELKRLAPLMGFSGYQPLVRFYVGQGLRADIARLESSPLQSLVDSLKRHGVPDETIEEAIADIAPSSVG